MSRSWRLTAVALVLGAVKESSGFLTQPLDARSVSTKPVQSSASAVLREVKGDGEYSLAYCVGPSSSSAVHRNGQRRTRTYGGEAVAVTSAIGWGQSFLGGVSGSQEGLLDPDQVEELENQMLDYFQGRDFALNRVSKLFQGLSPEEVCERWPSWRDNCNVLFTLGFNVEDITTILLKSADYIHDLDAERDIRRTILYLWQDLGLERWGKIGSGNKAWARHKYRIVTRAPEILRKGTEGGMKETVATLEQVGMEPRAILDAAFRFPSLLCVAPSLVFLVSAFLSSKEVGFKARELGALYRRNPWLLHPHTVSRLRPVVAYLRNALQVTRVHSVIRGFPQVVMRSVDEDIHPRVAVLQSLGIPAHEMGRMVEMFPNLLSLDTDAQIMPVLYFLQAELDLTRYEVWMLLRAFPGTLGLDVEGQMEPAVRFLRDIGIRNVKSFVKRHPPVLGYPVEWELKKKYDFLRSRLHLGLRELDAFPAYFSYSLVGRIIPRMDFMLKRGRKVDGVMLRVALTVSDDGFASLAGVSPEEYAAYETEYKKASKLARARSRGTLQKDRGGWQEESVCD